MAFDNYYVYQSAAYEWIDRFLKNCDFSHGSNSQICADTAEADTGVMGFFVYNKTRKLEKEQMECLNVDVPPWAIKLILDTQALERKEDYYEY